MGTYAVTGSASGIGAATRARLEHDGHRVLGVDVRDADLVCDLSTGDGRQAAIGGVLELAGGRLDGLVTCAGIAGYRPDAGPQVISVNYFGTIALLEGLRPALAAGERPAAVTISSNSTTCQPDWPLELAEACLAGDEEKARLAADGAGQVAYPASKAAVAWWVRANAVTPEWIGAGIRLNAIAPGMIDTAMVQAGFDDPVMAPLLEQFPIPAGRRGRAEEMAALIAFLLGPESTFFCGSVVFADGGTDALLRGRDFPSIWHLGGA